MKNTLRPALARNFPTPPPTCPAPIIPIFILIRSQCCRWRRGILNIALADRKQPSLSSILSWFGTMFVGPHYPDMDFGPIRAVSQYFF